MPRGCVIASLPRAGSPGGPRQPQRRPGTPALASCSGPRPAPSRTGDRPAGAEDWRPQSPSLGCFGPTPAALWSDERQGAEDPGAPARGVGEAAIAPASGTLRLHPHRSHPPPCPGPENNSPRTPGPQTLRRRARGQQGSGPRHCPRPRGR